MQSPEKHGQAVRRQRDVLAGRDALATGRYTLKDGKNSDFVKSVMSRSEWRDEEFFGGMACFRHPKLEHKGSSSQERHNPFRSYVGCRVEALDRQFPHLCCVATISAVQGEYVQVRFVDPPPPSPPLAKGHHIHPQSQSS